MQSHSWSLASLLIIAAIFAPCNGLAASSAAPTATPVPVCEPGQQLLENNGFETQPGHPWTWSGDPFNTSPSSSSGQASGSGSAASKRLRRSFEAPPLDPELIKRVTQGGSGSQQSSSSTNPYANPYCCCGCCDCDGYGGIVPSGTYDTPAAEGSYYMASLIYSTNEQYGLFQNLVEPTVPGDTYSLSFFWNLIAYPSRAYSPSSIIVTAEGNFSRAYNNGYGGTPIQNLANITMAHGTEGAGWQTFSTTFESEIEITLFRVNVYEDYEYQGALKRKVYNETGAMVVGLDNFLLSSSTC